MIYAIGTAIFWLIVNIFMPTRVIGLENVPKQGRLVMVCNHLSFFDIFVLLGFFPRVIHFVAKKEIFDKPVLGFLLRRSHVIPVNRGYADISALKAAESVLLKDEVFGIFPEGTRNKGDEYVMGPLQGGAAMMSIRTRSQIIPVMFSRKPRLFHTNILNIGKPFTLSEFYDKRLNSEVLQQATDKIRGIMEQTRTKMPKKRAFYKKNTCNNDNGGI